jgi:hypothetical protein
MGWAEANTLAGRDQAEDHGADALFSRPKGGFRSRGAALPGTTLIVVGLDELLPEVGRPTPGCMSVGGGSTILGASPAGGGPEAADVSAPAP